MVEGNSFMYYPFVTLIEWRDATGTLVAIWEFAGRQSWPKYFRRTAIGMRHDGFFATVREGLWPLV